MESRLLPLFVIIFLMDLAVGVLLYRDTKERQGIVETMETIAAGELERQVDTTNLHGDNLALAESVNSIGKGIKDAVEISMKDERMKADLITNVSHDIKTPLTSIINYVDLIKREQVDNEKVQSYIKVLDEKSQRLKQLTDDLVEASKISSGNINLHFERINLTELMNQTIGEFSEKFDQKNLTTVMNVNAANVVIEADSRRIWRVMENLFNNIYKYAMEGTRVYVSIDNLTDSEERIEVSIKNISASALNCNPDELTERFIRGDESRTTEGSGLGLSIAKNLTEAQKGTFDIKLDGDLFKVCLTFPIAQ
jgi:signal transduction histidine kinase